MSMEAANQILETLIRTKNLNHSKTPSMGSSSLSSRNLRDNAPASLPLKQAEYTKPSAEAVSAATTSYPPQSPTAASKQSQYPPRLSSVDAQKAAEAAIGMRSPSQQAPGSFVFFPLRYLNLIILTYYRPSTYANTATYPPAVQPFNFLKLPSARFSGACCGSETSSLSNTTTSSSSNTPSSTSRGSAASCEGTSCSSQGPKNWS